MSEVFELRKMLEEIIEDERVGTSRRTRVSQADIQRMVVDREKRLPKGKNAIEELTGELLVKRGLITIAQLNAALMAQFQGGGKIGSILVELGHVSPDALIEVLAAQFGTEGMSLLNVRLSQSVLSLLSLEIIQNRRVLPLELDGQSMKLAMESPNDFTTVHEIEFLTGKKVQPYVVPSYQMDAALQCIKQGETGLSHVSIEQTLAGPATLRQMLECLISSKASDLLVAPGVAPSLRYHNHIERSDMPAASAELCTAYARALMTERQWETFQENKVIEFATDFEALGRFRVNVYRTRNSVSFAVRRTIDSIPSLVALGLPEWLQDVVLKPQGLVLIASSSGHGKTTTFHSLIDIINNNRECNVITLEDPMELCHRPKKSNINQREVGLDAKSFMEGGEKIYRQAPQVIAISEIQSREACELALHAASCGHLVLSTINAPNAISAIDRLLAFFPFESQPRIRRQLADALLLIFAQRLLQNRDTGSVALAYEKMINSPRIKDLLIRNDIYEIQSNADDSNDFTSIDEAIAKLLDQGLISEEVVFSLHETLSTC